MGSLLLILQTDASDHYWGALLLEESEGNRRVCGYKSGQFNDAQSHYPSSKKEVLTVTKGIKKFQFFLSLTPFVIETDYKYLLGLIRRKEGEIPDPQLARWSESLSRFKFEVRHIKGESNTVADFLSRPINMITRRGLPRRWEEGSSSAHENRAHFLKNLNTFIAWLPSEVQEDIFEKTISHKRDPEDQALTWRVWQLMAMQEHRPAHNKRCQKAFDPHPNPDQMHETIFKVGCTFHYVIDENSNWGHYVICDITPQAFVSVYIKVKE